MIQYNDYNLTAEDEDGNKYILIMNESQPNLETHKPFIYKKVEQNDDI